MSHCKYYCVVLSSFGQTDHLTCSLKSGALRYVTSMMRSCPWYLIFHCCAGASRWPRCSGSGGWGRSLTSWRGSDLRRCRRYFVLQSWRWGDLHRVAVERGTRVTGRGGGDPSLRRWTTKKKEVVNFGTMSLSRMYVPLMQFPRIYIYPYQSIENTLIPTSTCIPTST